MTNPATTSTSRSDAAPPPDHRAPVDHESAPDGLRVGGAVALQRRGEWITSRAPLKSEPMPRRAGCGNSARPDPWEPRGSDPLGPPGNAPSTIALFRSCRNRRPNWPAVRASGRARVSTCRWGTYLNLTPSNDTLVGREPQSRPATYDGYFTRTGSGALLAERTALRHIGLRHPLSGVVKVTLCTQSRASKPLKTFR